MIDAIAREEFDRIVERMNVPSGAYAFMVIIDQARLELMRGIPHHLCPAPPKGRVSRHGQDDDWKTTVASSAADLDLAYPGRSEEARKQS